MFFPEAGAQTKGVRVDEMAEGGIDARKDVFEKFARRSCRLFGFRLCALLQFLVEKKERFLETLHDATADEDVIRRDDVPKPVDPAANVAEFLFLRMQFQLQFVAQEDPDLVAPCEEFT